MNRSDLTDTTVAFSWAAVVAIYGFFALHPQLLDAIALLLANFVVPVAGRFCMEWIKDYFDQRRKRRLKDREEKEEQEEVEED